MTPTPRDFDAGRTVARLLFRAAGAPRFIPMIGDSMAPMLQPDDFAGIAPVDGYSGPGVYAFERLARPVLKRAEHIQGTGRIRLTYDNPAYSPAEITVEQFTATVIGKVFALCSMVDAAAVLDGLESRHRFGP